MHKKDTTLLAEAYQQVIEEDIKSFGVKILQALLNILKNKEPGLYQELSNLAASNDKAGLESKLKEEYAKLPETTIQTVKNKIQKFYPNLLQKNSPPALQESIIDNIKYIAVGVPIAALFFLFGIMIFGVSGFAAVLVGSLFAVGTHVAGEKQKQREAQERAQKRAQERNQY